MELLKVDTLEEAREKIKAALSHFPMRTGKMPLIEAFGYTLSEDIYAPCPVPGFTRSTVDGYALRASDTSGAGESLPVFLHITGEIEMGQEAGAALGPGECVYVPTGGMVPEEADACVMIEYCEEFGGTQTAVYHAAAPWENITRAGDDMQGGERVLLRGTVLKAGQTGVLASLGITEVPVYLPWTVTIVSTGDELVSPEKTPGPGQVRDINTYGLYVLAEKLKLEIRNYKVIKDDKKLLLETVNDAKENSDIVLISGGSSKGKKDASKEVIAEACSEGILTYGLALKPGKPTILGFDMPARTLVAGLPGHPAAAMLVFELLIRWLWEEKTECTLEKWVPAVLTANIPGAPGKSTCQLVRLIPDEEKKKYQAVPVWGKSGLIHTLSSADGYIMIGENEEGLNKGALVKVSLL